jgi:hypothetical protein
LNWIESNRIVLYKDRTIIEKQIRNSDDKEWYISNNNLIIIIDSSKNLNKTKSTIFFILFFFESKSKQQKINQWNNWLAFSYRIQILQIIKLLYHEIYNNNNNNNNNNIYLYFKINH